MNEANQPIPLGWTENAYDILLGTYPGDFRGRHQTEMLQIFLEDWRALSQKSRWLQLSYLGHCACDFAVSWLREWWSAMFWETKLGIIGLGLLLGFFSAIGDRWPVINWIAILSYLAVTRALFSRCPRKPVATLLSFCGNALIGFYAFKFLPLLLHPTAKKLLWSDASLATVTLLAISVGGVSLWRSWTSHPPWKPDPPNDPRFQTFWGISMVAVGAGESSAYHFVTANDSDAKLIYLTVAVLLGLAQVYRNSNDSASATRTKAGFPAGLW